MRAETLRGIAAAVARGEIRATDLLREARETAARAADLNALAHVDWDAADAGAVRIDARAAAGEPVGPLAGVPVSIKDLFTVRGMPTRGGTRARLPDLGAEEATLVSRLRDAGAVIFAKTNMHEIALGATGENAWTGDVRNPHDPSRQAGGSSGGAAVAIASGIGLGAVGSDTGGSVRVPAALCGVVGFKPTFGAIPLDGALYLSPTCDHAGPIARSVDDCAVLFEVMARRSCGHARVPREPRLAVPRRWLAHRLSDPVAELFEGALARLRDAGARTVDVDSEAFELAWASYTPIVRAEAAYVHRAALAAGGEGFSESVLAPLRDGLATSAQRYLESMAARERVRKSIDALLADCDALALPTTSTQAPLRGSTEVTLSGGRTMSTREALLGQTLPFSLVGVPALSLPSGFANGLPASLQLVAARDRDAGLLALGRWVEAALLA